MQAIFRRRPGMWMILLVGMVATIIAALFVFQALRETDPDIQLPQKSDLQEERMELQLEELQRLREERNAQPVTEERVRQQLQELERLRQERNQ
ncbi:MAG: hypothetical protein Q8P39_01535 [Candidatus Yanofskybacteria bacterium]|nr:hypothetical protein [Candidatus Yanofskybacteria bacterium]